MLDKWIDPKGELNSIAKEIQPPLEWTNQLKQEIEETITERNYYKIFKTHINEPLSKYISHLDLNDWTEFFEDYYTHNLAFIEEILYTPKREDAYSYYLVLLDEVDISTRELITKANNSLFINYFNESKWDLISELFNTVRYLELNISTDLLMDIILNEPIESEVREHAAVVLSNIDEILLIPFWGSLNLIKNNFLIPSYISFFEKTNPIKGLSKLLLVDKPDDIEAYETPVFYSLLQIGNSLSDIEKYQELSVKFPIWVNNFIEDLCEDYPELSSFKENINKL